MGLDTSLEARPRLRWGRLFEGMTAQRRNRPDHQAGLDGRGGSSYIDSVILRQPDADSDAPPLSLEEGRGEGGSHSFLRLGGGRPGWGHSSTSSADGTLEERRYSCQNPVGWASRPSTSDSALITSGGLIVEWAKYSAYGIPFGLPGGDTDSDGDCDATDITQIQTWIDAPAYDVRGDINLDGSVNATDKSLAISNYQGTTSGWKVLSAASVANRIGYAGYQKDINLDISHVRNRILEPHLGRWTRRDPLGYDSILSTQSSKENDPVLSANNQCDGYPADNTIRNSLSLVQDSTGSVYPDGSSLYSYARQAPTVNRDPSGLIVCPPPGQPLLKNKCIGRAKIPSNTWCAFTVPASGCADGYWGSGSTVCISNECTGPGGSCPTSLTVYIACSECKLTSAGAACGLVGGLCLNSRDRYDLYCCTGKWRT